MTKATTFRVHCRTWSFGGASTSLGIPPPIDAIELLGMMRTFTNITTFCFLSFEATGLYGSCYLTHRELVLNLMPRPPTYVLRFCTTVILARLRFKPVKQSIPEETTELNVTRIQFMTVYYSESCAIQPTSITGFM